MYLTDKDCKELAAIEAIFPNAISLLCIFHVLMAVDRRLTSARLAKNEQEEIYEDFRKAVYAKSLEELEQQSEILCNIGKRDRKSYG